MPLELSPVVDWLPDETLFSLCSRFHFLSGHHVPAKTSQLLFGSSRAGAAHDVPAGVQSLIDRLPNLGNASEVILRHTLLPFYFPFHEAHRCRAWIEQMSGGSAPNLKAKLGLASSRFGAAHPLKACPDCMSQDVQLHGVAYWHVSHQLPGVIICPAHHTPLTFSSAKVSGQDRFGWVLPAEVTLNEIHRDKAAGKVAWELARASLAMHAMATDYCFSNDRMAEIYLRRMVEMGWTRSNQLTVARSIFEPELHRFIFESSMVQPWPWLIDDRGAHVVAERLIRISRGEASRESRHPMNHLILQLLLFGSWQSFLEEYLNDGRQPILARNFPVTAAPRARVTSSDQLLENNRSKLLRLLVDGHSITHAARECDIAVATAMRWACKVGVASSRRPKLLKEPVLGRLIRMLAEGGDKKEVAKKSGVSVQTVTRVLLTEPGLQKRWADTRLQKAQAQARSAWATVMSALPHASSRIWRQLEPAVYGWLYRNDRAWLQDSIAQRPQPASISPMRRNWAQRDQNMSTLVRKTALDWFSAHPKGHPALAQLCSDIRGLRQVLSVLHKLPLTQSAIQEICKSRRPGAASQHQSTFDGMGVVTFDSDRP